MQLTVVKCMKLGLEVYNVCIDGRLLYSFLSERHALSRFYQLKQKMGIK